MDKIKQYLADPQHRRWLQMGIFWISVILLVTVWLQFANRGNAPINYWYIYVTFVWFGLIFLLFLLRIFADFLQLNTKQKIYFFLTFSTFILYEIYRTEMTGYIDISAYVVEGIYSALILIFLGYLLLQVYRWDKVSKRAVLRTFLIICIFLWIGYAWGLEPIVTLSPQKCYVTFSGGFGGCPGPAPAPGGTMAIDCYSMPSRSEACYDMKSKDFWRNANPGESIAWKVHELKLFPDFLRSLI